VGDSRLARAVAAIDAANAGDPNRLVVGGVERPKELAHAEMVTGWVRRLRPDAGEALLLAARAHHVRRWEIDRSAYPEGRGGYLRWRRDLHRHHARVVARIVEDEGYDQATVARVEELVTKRNLASDPEVQVLEDALCLVFIESQFHDLASRLDDGKMVDVVRKTLKKMSDEGKRMAGTVEMDEADRALLEEALRG